MLILETEQNRRKYYTYNDFCIIENDITTEEERKKYSMNPVMEYVSTQEVSRKFKKIENKERDTRKLIEEEIARMHAFVPRSKR